MWSKIWYKINNSVVGGAFLIATFSFLSKIFGLVRERLIASTFGASDLSDIYYASFRLPDLIFNTLVLGALTSAFIPVFQKAWNSDREEGLRLASSVMNFFLLLIGVLVLLGIIFAPQLMHYIAPGFDSWQIDQASRMTRIMLLAVIFFVASNIMGGILNAWKRFFSFSLAASFYNIGIIVGIVVFYKYYGLIGLSYGVLLGSILHLLVQLPESIKYGWKYKLSLRFDSGLRRILKLMVPRTIGLAASQANLLVTTMIASTLPAGSIAIYSMADNLQSFPISIFAVSLAVAVFPTFTQAISDNDHEKFSVNFSKSFRRILFLLIPVAVFMLVLRAQIVRVILGSGNFSWENTYYTAQTLGFFALSMFASGLIPLLARSFYAFEDTKTPMVVSFCSIALNIILALIFARHLSVMGLALAYSIASIVNMVALFFLLHKKVPDISNQEIFMSSSKIVINSMLAGSICYLILQLMSKIVDMTTFVGIFTQGLVAGVAGLIVYLILSIVLKLPEMLIIKNRLSRVANLFRNGKN